MKINLLALFLCFTFLHGSWAQDIWVVQKDSFIFSWNLRSDHAKVENLDDQQIWSGSLLPSFWLLVNNEKVFVKPEIDLSKSLLKADLLDLALIVGDFGTGRLILEEDTSSIKFKLLTVDWKGSIPKIMGLYLGVTGLTTDQLAAVPDPSRPFSPDWSSFGYCIPGAKEGPAQSFFRSWDFGQANIALGSFGPSMGTPYGAAFPRPTFMASLGNDNGWITFGAGSIPDAPMTLQMRSAKGCIEYLYREDLWGKGPEERIWKDLITITFDKTAWEAMHNYVNTIPSHKPVNSAHHLSVWNTWGNWRTGNFTIEPIAELAHKTGAEVLVLDDPWESFHGSGTYDQQKFPTFFEDIGLIHKLGMSHGIWETLAWIDDPEELGLTRDDLMLDRNGNPCKGSWNFDPFGDNHYILDISSAHARNYLRERTGKVVRNIKPRLIKLDFGYGISNPNVGVPRNPEIRGERYSFELTKLIVETAKSIDPDIIVMYYAISPLFLPLTDMVSLDDQGDLWYESKQGHDQWSIWASLISQQRTAINGSSGYNWRNDDEILLNTAILGSPGSVLPNRLDGEAVPDRLINRRFAVNRWYRRTIQWEPLWLNSNKDGLSKPMKINCWGRVELNDSGSFLAALILRDETDQVLNKQLKNIQWKGRWAIISQDEHEITKSGTIAVIPFDDRSVIEFPTVRRPVNVSVINYQKEQSFKEWNWSDGIFKLDLAHTSIDEIAGFLIEMD